ncbi:MAG: hypothetical protein EA408_05615, partial [Marinilabiliales bacterium]
AGSIINVHMAQNDQNMDLSLADISVMAQADGESGGGGLLWKAEYTQTPCTYQLTTTVTVYCPITGSYITSTETVTYEGKVKNCIDGWWFCMSDCVG